MNGFNKVHLIGNLGQDPELKNTTTGKSVVKLRLACSEKYRSENEWKERTEWVDVILWEGLAKVANEYAKKGSRVFVEGRIQTRKYEDKKTHDDRYVTEVVGNNFILLDPPSHEKKTEKAEAFKATDDDIPF